MMDLFLSARIFQLDAARNSAKQSHNISSALDSSLPSGPSAEKHAPWLAATQLFIL